MPTTGHTLRIERVRARISVTALAAQMGISRQTLWTIERAAQVAPDRVADYRAAVRTLSDDTQGEAA